MTLNQEFSSFLSSHVSLGYFLSSHYMPRYVYKINEYVKESCDWKYLTNYPIELLQDNKDLWSNACSKVKGDSSHTAVNVSTSII